MPVDPEQPARIGAEARRILDGFVSDKVFGADDQGGCQQRPDSSRKHSHRSRSLFTRLERSSSNPKKKQGK